MSEYNSFSETLELAGVSIRINFTYSSLKIMCAAYLSKERPVFSVTATQDDIDFERGQMARKGDMDAEFSCSDAALEALAVYRKIAEAMPSYNTVLFHGSAIAVDGEAYLFTAPSGTGKSTHTRLWREMFDSRAIMVNDDKPLIKITNTGATIYGTPWDGKHHLSNNIAAPLRAICVLERALENSIHEITPSEALPILLQQVYRPMDAVAMKNTLNLIDQLSHSVCLYRLACNMDISAAALAYTTMKG